MRLLGLVPARGGSKRLPGKNIRTLGDRPLIAWTLRAAQDSGVLCDVLVSTDAPAIADTARQWGGWVPWLRPAGLAGDTSTSVEVAVHALDWYEAERGPVDGLMLLQPTSPFRHPDSIRRAAALFESGHGHPVVSLCPAASHPAWTFRIEGGALVPYLGWQALGRRAQDLEPAYTLNGAIYLVAPDTLRKQAAFVTEATLPLVMDDPAESLDIDTASDWLLAEHILRQREREGATQP